MKLYSNNRVVWLQMFIHLQIMLKPNQQHNERKKNWIKSKQQYSCMAAFLITSPMFVLKTKYTPVTNINKNTGEFQQKQANSIMKI